MNWKITQVSYLILSVGTLKPKSGEAEKSTSFFIAFSLEIAEFGRAGVIFQVNFFFLRIVSQFIGKHNIFIVL